MSGKCFFSNNLMRYLCFFKPGSSFWNISRISHSSRPGRAVHHSLLLLLHFRISILYFMSCQDVKDLVFIYTSIVVSGVGLGMPAFVGRADLHDDIMQLSPLFFVLQLFLSSTAPAACSQPTSKGAKGIVGKISKGATQQTSLGYMG